ncbi:MAG TPA: cytochrome c oxidase assembly protein [Solirubrobacterales bacterium]|nr:cytochrome c oxidase assembly protein [Solirubrobacterales bacterium]
MFALETLASASLAAVGIAYAIRASRLAVQGRPLPTWRLASFAAGIVVLVVAIASPLEQLAEELITGHMVQHLLIIDIAALLLVLGLTGPILQPVLAVRWLRWIRALAHPIVSFVLWAAILYVWHIPALYQAATFDSPLLHGIEHATFLFAGLGIWLSLIGPLPKPAWFGNGAKVIYVIAVRLVGTVLANVLMWSGSPLYPDYEPSQLARGVEPLSDQGWAGIVMMFESTVVTLATLTWLFFLWARQDIERQELLDYAADRGIALDPERAGRAVAAGQGERLRERIGATPDS